MMTLSFLVSCILVLGMIESGRTCCTTTTTTPKPKREERAESCTEKKALGGTSGVHTLYSDKSNVDTAYQAYCDMAEDGEWLVLMRRVDGTVGFNMGWGQYKNGFGDLSTNFWLGNNLISKITQKHQVTAKFTTEGVDADVPGVGHVTGGTRTALYSTFKVAGSSDKHRLTIGGHSGDLHDSMAHANGAAFTTKNQDNNNHHIVPAHAGTNCASKDTVKGEGGWWYAGSICAYALFTGSYQTPGFQDNDQGIYWFNWRNGVSTFKYKLKYVDIKIKF